MSTKKKKISELKEADELNNNDWLVIEKREGTRKIQAGNIGMNTEEIDDLTRKLQKATDRLSSVEQLLVSKFPTSYKQPTLTLTSNEGTKLELGTTINPTISAKFTQNDAGTITNYKLIKDGLTKVTSSTVQDFTESFKLIETVQYRAEVSYLAGQIKPDSLGKPNPNGQIQAGTIYSTPLTINAVRAAWGCISSSANAPTVDDIRNATVSGLGLQQGSTIRATATAGSTRTIIFAYPKFLGQCNKIRYDELNDNANQSAFKQITLSIPDASKTSNHIDYIVYYYTAPKPFSSTATFILTI